MNRQTSANLEPVIGGPNQVQPYYFTPSQRQARTVAEFLAVCGAEPQLAVHHLREGYFEPWLRDVGRNDLAEAAGRIRLSGSVTRRHVQEFVQGALEREVRPQPRSASTRTGSKAPAPKKGA